MSGDYTRFSFDPRRRFIAVDMQQGRVQLDADWNEQADLARERIRLLGLDTGGTAWMAATTPDAFLVGALPGPPADLSLQPGRLYVDGRLAEIFPAEPITYLNQPFLPDPAPLTPATDTIVYLELWEREVTWAEMPALLDVALGGIDTTTRVQQVWQVKLHAQAGMSACGVDLGALFPPSAGRLTTSANAPPAPDDPCILPPNAGYRGIENRLYRVEIQAPGPLGTALFKWSRDNGSIVSRVSAITIAGSQTRLTVNRMGRDGTLRLRIDDWVTLTDDFRELNGEAGQMARIVDIDETARVVVLDRAVPTAGRAFGVGAADIAARNTRIQRWDESAPLNPIDADGLMTTAAGPLLLEDGVEVAFSTASPGGAFAVGDYWVFAARTADASVEILTAAPPRGLRRQYLQLAAIPAGGAPTDCRPIPAVLDATGCCTFVIRPGQDIQKALDTLAKLGGGCICLKAGRHSIDRPLLLQGSNITLHGESLAAIVVNLRGTGVIIVGEGRRNRIHSLTLQQPETVSRPVVTLQNSREFRIEDCYIETVPRLDSVGIFALGSADVSIADCHTTGNAIGVWLDRGCDLVTITGCEFQLADTGPNLPETVGVVARTMRGPLFAEGNLIVNAIHGIIVNDGGAGAPFSRANASRILDNVITLSPVRIPQRRYGIDAAAQGMQINGNEIGHQGGLITAIRVAGNGSAVRGNIVVANAKTPDGAVGIVAGDQQAGVYAPLERIVIAENIISGSQNGIAVAGLARGLVNANIIGGAGAALAFGIMLDHVTDTGVSGNEVAAATFGVLSTNGARNAFRDHAITGGRVGLTANQEVAPVFAGNRLIGLEQCGMMLTAIAERCEIASNRILRCGAQAKPIAAGIAAILVLGELHVIGNEIMDIGDLTATGTPPAAVGLAALYILEARVTSNLITYSAPTLRSPANEDRALLMQGLLETRLPAGPAIVAGFAVQISDNKFFGTGASALVELRDQVVDINTRRRFERVIFSGNYCAHMSQPFNDSVEAATVSLVGSQCSIASNHVKATTPQFRSWHLHGMPGPFTGNVSHGISWDRNPAAGFPAPEQNFNIVV